MIHFRMRVRYFMKELIILTFYNSNQLLLKYLVTLPRFILYITDVITFNTYDMRINLHCNNKFVKKSEVNFDSRVS